MKLMVGTRGSQLSLAQTKIFTDLLKKMNPDFDIEIRIIKTLGDRDQRPLYQLAEKGIFEKDIDRALSKGEIDFAVHSLKDIPTVEPEGLTIASIPKRGSPRDALVSRDKSRLLQLKPNALLGTSSLRRMAQVKRVRPDLEVKSIRGNEETRVRKVLSGEYDCTILSEAGLQRIGLQDHIAEVLSLDEFPPSAGQGALAVMARKDDTSVIRWLVKTDHRPSRAAVEAERSFTSKMEGGCHVPLGVIGRVRGEALIFKGTVYAVDGRTTLTSMIKGPTSSAKNLGSDLAEELLKMGASSLVSEWRRLYKL